MADDSALARLDAVIWNYLGMRDPEQVGEWIAAARLEIAEGRGFTQEGLGALHEAMAMARAHAEEYSGLNGRGKLHSTEWETTLRLADAEVAKIAALLPKTA